MVDLKKLGEEREKDLSDSLRIIDIMAGWIKSKPNRVWSGKQAALFKSVYSSINKNWKAGLAKAGR
ncbi:MAG: hypothetical protein AB1657_05985 [Candidatus Micrarchaeota archaeon]